jgi:hypothetical protein
VELSATLVSVHAGQPLLYLDQLSPGKLPGGPLHEQDPTLELGVRRLLEDSLAQPVGYVEQLYTFGDRQRGAKGDEARVLSIAYLALMRSLPRQQTVSFYDLFPWEDRREPWSPATHAMLEQLEAWCGQVGSRVWRYRVYFGQHGSPWSAERALERYELLYEAGLVQEAGRGQSQGLPLWADHRRIAATALSRLRGKLGYRPLVFELLPDRFTLTELQETVEALSGGLLHKQNFRRMVETAGLVEMTGESRSEGRGRPARLYQFRSDVTAERPAPGIAVNPFRS